MRLDYNHSPLQCKQCHVQVHLLQDKDDQQDGVEDDHDEEVYQDADLFGEGLADIPADPLPNNPFCRVMSQVLCSREFQSSMLEKFYCILCLCVLIKLLQTAFAP